MSKKTLLIHVEHSTGNVVSSYQKCHKNNTICDLLEHF